MPKPLNTPEEFVEIYQGIVDGKTIQYWEESDKEWLDSIDVVLGYELSSYLRYRVKPDTVTVWVNMYDDGSALLWHSKEEANNNLDGVTHMVPVEIHDDYRVNEY